MHGSFTSWSARFTSSSSLLQPLVLSDRRPLEHLGVFSWPRRAPSPFSSSLAPAITAPPRAASAPFPSLSACFDDQSFSIKWSIRIFV